MWRWLHEDAIRPWQHRTWIFPRDPEFAAKAGRVDEGTTKTRRLVIGVVSDVRSDSPDPRPRPVIYVPHAQSALADMAFVVRLEEQRPLPIDEIRRMLRSMDPMVGAFEARTMDAVVTSADGMARFVATLLGVFTFVGLALVAAGIYGVLAFVVAMRQREIGVRLALGARFAQIARIVLGFAARVVAVGAVAGILGFSVLGRLFESLLFGVTRTDAAAVAGVLGVLASVTLLVCVSPLLRALRVSPLIVMRSE